MSQPEFREQTEQAASLTRENKWLVKYLAKMKGSMANPMEPVEFPELFWSSLSCVIGIGVIALLASIYWEPLVLTSFGSSAALVYSACHAPLSQPRNLVGGQVVSAFSGVLVYHLCGDGWWAVAAAVALSVALMLLTRTLHPPGGATALAAVQLKADWLFIFLPVALGAVILLLVALLVSNLDHRRNYPLYWW